LAVAGVLATACVANASATLLLEEPYGKLGWFTATGHAAVYLSGVCAETPLMLRPCREGELGVVISRYNGVGGYDWLAVPLIPYLYAVESVDEIPLFADPRMVNFLRDQYRRNHLEAVAPDLAGGETPGGNWYQLVGSAYDRTSYGFQIETARAQDLAFIRAYNSSQNRSHFVTVSSNCADFAKDVINFYYPRALHRSVVADVGISTPKQMAKALVRFSGRHRQLEFSRYVIPQIPGGAARSSAVHGVVESFFKSKKYIVPSALVSPVFAGCVAAVYLGTAETSRFDPARQALIYGPGRELEPPLDNEDRRSYEIELKHLEAVGSAEAGGIPNERNFTRSLATAVPGFDANGRPVLRMKVAEAWVTLGVTPANLPRAGSSRRLAEQLLEARLRAELGRRSPPKVSASDLESDWSLLQQAIKADEYPVADRAPGVLQEEALANRNHH
jgi:hypothetical protein